MVICATNDTGSQIRLAAGRPALGVRVIQLSLTQPRDVRNAWIFWAALIVVVGVMVLPGNTRTVTGYYRLALPLRVVL